MDQAERDRLLALAPTRHEMYTFLSKAFRQAPSLAQLQAVTSDEFLQSAGELFGDRAQAALRHFAARDETLEQVEREARQEFMSLFKVPGTQYVAPYESVYRDAREIAGRKVKGLLMGKSAIDVQKWYRLAALEICEEYGDLPDHISLELAYLAHLCGKEPDFASAHDWARLTRAWEMERDFLAQHLVPWVVPLREKVYEKSEHGYFRAVGDMVVRCVSDDLAILEEAVGCSGSLDARGATACGKAANTALSSAQSEKDDLAWFKKGTGTSP